MSGLPVAARKNLFVSAPRAYAAAGAPGQVAAFAVSGTATYVDMTQGISQAARDMAKSGQDPKSPTRNYLAIVSNVDLGVMFGPTAASVTAGNVPALATVGALASGVYTGAAGTCFLIPANTPHRFLLQEGVDLFLGIVASGAGTCRIYQSSPDDA
jgi:hypothetical protein